MRGLSTGLLLAALLALTGCSETTAPEPASDAEVPVPGSDVELGDPGPAPEGQSEPESESPEAVPPAPGDPDPISDDNARATPAGGGDASAGGDVTVEVADWSAVERQIAAHKGKVVVVDLWSTSCIPCRREFPQLVKLHEELGDAVACISVSLDYSGIPSKPPESYLPKVTEFLKSQNATFQNILSSVDAETLFGKLKIGSIPAVYVYDQEGKLSKRFADPADGEEHTYAGDIRPYVEGLLN
jgi:thiol-disulfide isomerase/thioredoxin